MIKKTEAKKKILDPIRIIRFIGLGICIWVFSIILYKSVFVVHHPPKVNEYDTAADKIKKIKYGMTFQDMNMLFGDAYYVGFTSSGLWFRHYVAWSVHEDGIKTVCAVFETPTINNWWNRRAATLTRAGYSMITDDKTEIHYVVDQMKYTDEDFHLSDEQIDYFEQLNKELQEKATVN